MHNAQFTIMFNSGRAAAKAVVNTKSPTGKGQ